MWYNCKMFGLISHISRLADGKPVRDLDLLHREGRNWGDNLNIVFYHGGQSSNHQLRHLKLRKGGKYIKTKQSVEFEAPTVSELIDESCSLQNANSAPSPMLLI